jgi:hypothetical protein
MKITVPHWAEDIENEGVLTLLAFLYKMCEEHGYEQIYLVDATDVAKMCDKHHNGIENWLLTFPEVKAKLQIGTPYSHTISFILPPRPLRGHRVPTQAVKTLKTERQKLIWMYLLGCLNHNLIYDGRKSRRLPGGWTSHVKEMNLTRDYGSALENKDDE